MAPSQEAVLFLLDYVKRTAQDAPTTGYAKKLIEKLQDHPIQDHPILDLGKEKNFRVMAEAQEEENRKTRDRAIENMKAGDK